MEEDFEFNKKKQFRFIGSFFLFRPAENKNTPLFYFTSNDNNNAGFKNKIKVRFCADVELVSSRLTSPFVVAEDSNTLIYISGLKKRNKARKTRQIFQERRRLDGGNRGQKVDQQQASCHVMCFLFLFFSVPGGLETTSVCV